MKKAQGKREDFTAGKEIGVGSFSTVLKAVEIATGKEVALKICNKSFLKKNHKERAIMTEKTVWSRLHHPNIIQLYDTFQNNEKLCLFERNF
jgi:serine/threonine protein kinase